MEQRLAQAAPNNGASNATDFQPTTRNPQAAPGAVQQTGTQGITNPQEFLDDNKTTELTVNAIPAPAPTPTASNDVASFVLIAAVLIGLGILLFKFSSKLPSKKPATKVVESKPVEKSESKIEEAPKKPSVKRKTVKKSKRRNR